MGEWLLSCRGYVWESGYCRVGGTCGRVANVVLGVRVGEWLLSCRGYVWESGYCYVGGTRGRVATVV